MIGDGMDLPITHSSSTTLPTPTHTFTINNIHCVPSMKMNLISISQFCTSNNVSIEFLLSSFPVKDFHIGAAFLIGPTKDGVYEWPVSSSPPSSLLAFSSVKTTSSEWYHRLGHLAFSILKHLVPNYQLDLSNSMSSNLLCNACQCNKSHKLYFSVSSFVSSQPLEIQLFLKKIINVWTSLIISHDGFNNYVNLCWPLHQDTKYIWFYPIRKKFEVHDVFTHFKALVKKIL